MKILTLVAFLNVICPMQAQVMDTTFVIDARNNCILLSGNEPQVIDSIVVGVDSPNVLIPLSTYEITVSGEASSGPTQGLMMPGVFVHFYDRERGIIFRTITKADTVTFIPPFLTSRQYFYAWVTDNFNLNDNIGAFQLRLRVLSTTVVESNAAEPARHFQLEQNYPNPFNPTTVINYQLPISSSVKLSIYSITGQLVRTLVDEQKSAGRHQVVWDGLNERGERLPSGIYLYRIEAGDFRATRRLALVK